MHHPVRRRKRRSHGVSSSASFNAIGVRAVDVVRGNNGFGFTISGQQPCLLSCIVAGSPAESAGLRPGHALVAVNGRLVARLPHDTVVRLIGVCTGMLRLHVAENYYPHSSDSDVEDVDAYLPRRPAQGRAARVVRDLHTGAMFVEKTAAPSCSPPLQLPPRGVQNPPPPPPPSRIQPSDFRAVVGYLGTIELPKVLLPGSKLAVIRSCVRRMRAEKRVHTTVMLIVRKQQSVILADSLGTVLAEFSAERVAFCGACADDKRFFGLVTSVPSVDDDDDDVSAACGGSSCHVFRVEPSTHPHASHVQRAAAFRIVCTPSGEGCAEFPAQADPILRAVAALYNPADPPPPPPRSNTSSCPSSNSDSGIGFREEPNLHEESTVQDRLTVRAMPDPPCIAAVQQQLKLSPKVYGLPVAQSLEDLPPAAAAAHDPSGDESMSSLEHHHAWGSLQDLRTLPARHQHQGRRRKRPTHHQHPPTSSSVSSVSAMPPPPPLVTAASLAQQAQASSLPSPQQSDDEEEPDYEVPFKRWCSGLYLLNPAPDGEPPKPRHLDFSSSSILLDVSPTLYDPNQPLPGRVLLDHLNFSSNVSPVSGPVNPTIEALDSSSTSLSTETSYTLNSGSLKMISEIYSDISNFSLSNVPKLEDLVSSDDPTLDMCLKVTNILLPTTSVFPKPEECSLDVSQSNNLISSPVQIPVSEEEMLLEDPEVVLNKSEWTLEDDVYVVSQSASVCEGVAVVGENVVNNSMTSKPLLESNVDKLSKDLSTIEEESSILESVTESPVRTTSPLETDLDTITTNDTVQECPKKILNTTDNVLETDIDSIRLLEDRVGSENKQKTYIEKVDLNETFEYIDVSPKVEKISTAKIINSLKFATTEYIDMEEKLDVTPRSKVSQQLSLMDITDKYEQRPHPKLGRYHTLDSRKPWGFSHRLGYFSVMNAKLNDTLRLAHDLEVMEQASSSLMSSHNQKTTLSNFSPESDSPVMETKSIPPICSEGTTPVISRTTSPKLGLISPCKMIVTQSKFGSITSLTSSLADVKETPVPSRNASPTSSDLLPPCQMTMTSSRYGSVTSLASRVTSLSSRTGSPAPSVDSYNTRYGSSTSLSEFTSSQLLPPCHVTVNHSNYGSVTSVNSVPEQRCTPSRKQLHGSMPSLTSKKSTFNLAVSEATTPMSGKSTKDGDAHSAGTCRSQSEGGSSEAEPGRGGGPNSCFDSFERLLDDPNGMHAFAEFLKKEFSHENIYFWVACEKYRRLREVAARKAQARAIFQRHLGPGAPEPVNVDSQARQAAREGLDEAKPDLFVSAQKQIFNLMKFDSYPRFLKSDGRDDTGLLLEFDPDLLLHAGDEPNPGKLKKSRSDAEERRRKSLLPWHRGKTSCPRTRSKSRDREAGSSGTGPPEADSASSVRSELTGSRSSLASSDLALIQRGSSSRQSLSSGEAGAVAELCRVHLPDGATTVVAAQRGETVKQLIARLLEKRGLHYSSFELFLAGSGKPVALGDEAAVVLGGQEVRVEQRVVFRLDLPSRKTVGVKAKAGRTLAEVLHPILHKYGYRLDNTTITLLCDTEPLDPSLQINAIENQRLQATVSGPDGWRDRVVKQQQSGSSGATLLDQITNRVFEELLQGKTDENSGQQSRPLSDQGSVRSEDWSSEHSSGIFGRFLRRDSAFLDKTRESRSKGKKSSVMQAPLQQSNKHASLELDHHSKVLGVGNVASSSSQPSQSQTGPAACVAATAAAQAAAKAKWKLRPQAHGRSESDELYEGLKRAQRRMDDQRGTEINFELPDFLKDKENTPQQRRMKKGRLGDVGDVWLPLLGGGDGIDLSATEGLLPSPGQAEAYFAPHNLRCSLTSEELTPPPPERHNNAPPPLPPKPKTFPPVPTSKWLPADFSSASEEDSGNNNTRPASQNTTSFV